MDTVNHRVSVPPCPCVRVRLSPRISPRAPRLRVMALPIGHAAYGTRCNVICEYLGSRGGRGGLRSRRASRDFVSLRFRYDRFVYSPHESFPDSLGRRTGSSYGFHSTHKLGQQRSAVVHSGQAGRRRRCATFRRYGSCLFVHRDADGGAGGEARHPNDGCPLHFW